MNLAAKPAKRERPRQRVQVERELFRPGECKICVEQFDAKLGWYRAGSVRIPFDQLTELQEELQRIQAQNAEAENDSSRIIPVCFDGN